MLGRAGEEQAMDFSIETGTEVLRGTPGAFRGMLSGLSDGWLSGD